MGNGNFLAQAYTIFAGLNVIVQSMNSVELVSQEIQLLGAAHVPRGVTIPMFEVCRQILYWLLLYKFQIGFHRKVHFLL